MNDQPVCLYGSPWSAYCGTWAFMVKPENAAVWDKIPSETDILVTHGPAYGTLDVAWNK